MTATDYRNIMIFKFCQGTVQDLVGSPEKWTSYEDFSIYPDANNNNIALVGLSTWLHNYIQSAIDIDKQSPKYPLYENFVNIVQNQNWNGILVLRANVETPGFPDQIKGLAAGIDVSHFEAHHFGLTVSREGNQSVSSSWFGLIDYEPYFRKNIEAGVNTGLPLKNPVSGDYAFTVLQLQALFDNSALVNFNSLTQGNFQAQIRN